MKKYLLIFFQIDLTRFCVCFFFCIFKLLVGSAVGRVKIGYFRFKCICIIHVNV